MPFWRRRYRRYRRRPWYSRRRPRNTFWRTFRRRRRYRVRRHFKRKLKKLHIQQWQPPTIKKLKITGMYQLFFTNHQRINNNNTLYIDAIAPFHIPSGGGFSLTQFTLQNLFDQHLRLRNWWTKSNDLLPLIRYTGCTMYFYYQENVDYIVAYDTNFPMKASRLSYNGTQPSVMQLMRHRKVIPCKHYNRRRRPYKKVKIRPPAQLKNQWYFQHNLADIPLVNLLATACSLDRWYTGYKAITPTIGFHILNSKFWLNHRFKDEPTYGYQPQENHPLFGLQNGHTDITQITIGELIYLGNAENYGYGTQLKLVITTQNETFWNKYFTDKTHWGNPFMTDYMVHTKQTVQCIISLSELKNLMSAKSYNMSTKLSEIKTTGNISPFQITKQENFINCRYNPYADKGIGNEVYFLPITNNANYGWEPQPNKPELIAKDLPLWCLYWGLVDFHKRASTITSIETHGITVFKTQYITPKDEPYYIPIGEYFMSDRSEYLPPAQEHWETQRTDGDEKHWHPKLLFQLDAITAICQSGPGTVKLPPDGSCEAHVKYQFHFKIGGSPPPMEIVTDPSKQPIWPIPNNFHENTSLQSPGTPFEYFLYNFDQRGDYLTKKAVARLKKDFPSKEIIPSLTGQTGLNIPTQKTQESDSDSSTEEETQTSIQRQLLQHRREQLELRHRIHNLLLKLSTSE
nr:MAG: ORF1 [TTV-like mini virus]